MFRIGFGGTVTVFYAVCKEGALRKAAPHLGPYSVCKTSHSLAGFFHAMAGSWLESKLTDPIGT